MTNQSNSPEKKSGFMNLPTELIPDQANLNIETIENKTTAKESPVAKETEPAAAIANIKTSAPITAASAAKNIKIQEIENILEEDLSDIYFSLNPVEQKKFKEEGENAAQKINQLLQGAIIKIKQIIQIIRNWLRIIPGINRFFLEQEIKIKAEKISKLINSEKKIK